MAHDEKNVYRTSRRAYFWNYVLAGLVAVFLYLLITTYGFTFSFIPTDFTTFWQTMAILGIAAVIAFLSEEPIIAGIVKHYIIAENEIIRIEGVLRKKRFVLPYQGIADVRVTKGILGRILNYGDVEIVGFREGIEMKGMSDPDRLQDLIQQKMSSVRGGFMSRRRHKNQKKETEE